MAFSMQDLDPSMHSSHVTALIITSGYKLSSPWMGFNHELTVYPSCFLICFIILNRLSWFSIYHNFDAVLERD